MYANALYQRGFVKEGYKALQALADASMDFENSKIYPGIPEYFNAKGRGMYHYLTGAASWYMLTLITEAYGVKGVAGDLTICPKLVREQFDQEKKAWIELPFAGRCFQIVIDNPENLEYGEYAVKAAEMEGNVLNITVSGVVLKKSVIDSLAADVHKIVITLGK